MLFATTSVSDGMAGVHATGTRRLNGAAVAFVLSQEHGNVSGVPGVFSDSIQSCLHLVVFITC